jgi:glycosyltransferase involved in cell wall biosynthesis
MCIGAFALLEVNLWLPTRNNFFSMSLKTIGRFGNIFSLIIYLLLLYSLIAAYISGCSDLLHGFLLNNNPLQVNYFYHKKVQEWINNNIKKYDIAFCSTIRTTEYVKDKDIYKIIDFVDAISMNYEKAFKIKRMSLWKLMYKIDKNRVFKYERKILNSFDKKIIISQVDKDYIINENDNTDIEVIPNGVLIDETNNSNEKEVISFIGKMNYEPNQTAVLFFVDNIFPHVLKKFPDLIFKIVGIKPTKKLKKLEKKYKNVFVTGYVEDINKYISESKLIIAPMISGAGIQNKIIQSMYLQKCVITTSLGAEGITKITDRELVIEDNNIQIAEKIIYYLNNKEERKIIGINAKIYIDNTFSQSIIKNKLINYLEK